jgi:predicted TIM-barrel enzyme
MMIHPVADLADLNHLTRTVLENAAMAADVAEVLGQTRKIVGSFGASCIERLPTEPAIVEQAKRFTTLRLSVH